MAAARTQSTRAQSVTVFGRGEHAASRSQWESERGDGGRTKTYLP